MSDTPRTDAETMQDKYDHVDTEFGEFASSNTVSATLLATKCRELAEVTKQRDALISAMEEIGGGAHGWKTCVDQIAPRAIAEATGQTYDEVVKKLWGLKGGAQ